MNVLFTQIAGLTGLFVFLSQMWTYASVEKSVFVAIASGLAVYLVLVVGDFTIRTILDFQISGKEVPEGKGAGEGGSEENRQRASAS